MTQHRGLDQSKDAEGQHRALDAAADSQRHEDGRRGTDGLEDAKARGRTRAPFCHKQIGQHASGDVAQGIESQEHEQADGLGVKGGAAGLEVVAGARQGQCTGSHGHRHRHHDQAQHDTEASHQAGDRTCRLGTRSGFAGGHEVHHRGG